MTVQASFFNQAAESIIVTRKADHENQTAKAISRGYRGLTQGKSGRQVGFLHRIYAKTVALTGF
jgi:hypothetical protein